MPTTAARKASTKVSAQTREQAAAKRASRSEAARGKSATTSRSKAATATPSLGLKHSVRAKLFQNGRSQAVRLPKEFRFEGKEVQVSRQGNGILLTPVETKTTQQYWDEYFKALAPYQHLPFPDCEDDTVTHPEDIFAEGWV